VVLVVVVVVPVSVNVVPLTEAVVVVVVLSVQSGCVPWSTKLPSNGHTMVAGSPSYRYEHCNVQFSPGNVLPQSLASKDSPYSGTAQRPANAVVVVVVVVVVVDAVSVNVVPVIEVVDTVVVRSVQSGGVPWSTKLPSAGHMKVVDSPSYKYEH
jgi:hypothetical protein